MTNETMKWERITSGFSKGNYVASGYGRCWEIFPGPHGWVLFGDNQNLGKRPKLAEAKALAMEVVQKEKGASVTGSSLACSTPCRMHGKLNCAYGPQCPGANGRKRS